MARDEAQVIIVGGGFAGLALAAGLAKRGLEVLVLEALSGPIPALRGELLHPPGVRALRELGLDEAVRRAGADPVVGFAAFATADRAPVTLDYPSGSGLGLEHCRLVEALFARVSALPGVRIERGARVLGPWLEGERTCGVELQGGARLRASWLVAADGRHSRMRRAWAIPTTARLLSYTAGLGLEGVELPVPGRGHVFTGGPGPVLAYPFGSGRVRMNLDVPLDAARGPALPGYLWEHYAPVLPPALQAALRRGLTAGELALCANQALTTEICAVPGAALVGDAGGCTHPLTATGMTSALNDIGQLLACLEAEGLSDAALLAYQRRRYRYVRARELFAQALYEVLRGAGPGAQLMRQAVFDHWREPRGRRASMAILSGDESDGLHFASEYARVVARSAWLALTQARAAGQAPPPREALAGLAGEVHTCAENAWRLALQTVAAEQTPRLTLLRKGPEPSQPGWAPMRWLRAPLRPRAPTPAGEPPPAE